MILVIHIWISLWIIQATEKYGAAIYYFPPRVFNSELGISRGHLCSSSDTRIVKIRRQNYSIQCTLWLDSSEKPCWLPISSSICTSLFRGVLVGLCLSLYVFLCSSWVRPGLCRHWKWYIFPVSYNFFVTNLIWKYMKIFIIWHFLNFLGLVCIRV